MKKQAFTLILLLITSFFTSCSKDDIEYQNEFERSYQAWLNFKKESNNSYTYTMASASWVGTATRTTITVENGKIVERHFKYTAVPPNSAIPTEMLEWTENENENEINTHQGAEALTLDQIYDKAKNDWLLERKNAKTYFEAKNNGLISSCGYVEDGCQDDCFRGIGIASIEKK